jgi:hypothetical protein
LLTTQELPSGSQYRQFLPRLEKQFFCKTLILNNILFGTGCAMPIPTTWTGEFAVVNGEKSRWKTHSSSGWRGRERCLDSST